MVQPNATPQPSAMHWAALEYDIASARYWIARCYAMSDYFRALHDAAEQAGLHIIDLDFDDESGPYNWQ